MAAVATPEILVKDKWIPDPLRAQMREWSPKSQLGKIAKEALAYLPSELAGELLDRISSCVVIESRLSLVVFEQKRPGLVVPYDLGEVGHKVVTTAGVNFIVDAFQNTVELENLKYHGIGTGSTAEAVGNTDLVTELTTEYNPNSTRATGTTAEGSSANIYQTVATNTLDGTPGAALREHGVFDNATVGSGTLLDRTVYAAITLSSGDALQSTYELTCSAGG